MSGLLRALVKQDQTIKKLPALFHRGQHLAPQDRIDPGLVALTLGLEPVQHVGVYSRGYLAFARAIEVAAAGVLPLFLRHFRDVAGINLTVGTSG